MIRIGLTILLTMLNAAWISFFVYVKKHPSQEKIQPTLSVQQNVFNLNTIEVQFANKTPIILSKKNDDWFLQTPIQWEANRMVVDNLLQTLTILNPIFSFKIDKTVDLGNYGLAFPFCIIKFNTESRSYRIHLGHPMGENNKIYALEVGKNEIFVLDTKLTNAITLTLEQWANPFIFKDNHLSSIHFDTNVQKLFLDYEQQKWNMKAPIVAKADQQHAEAVCQQLLNLEYFHFLEASELEQWLPLFSKAQDRFQLKIQNESNVNELSILPYDIEKHIFIGQRNNLGPLFLFKSTVIERLLNPQETLRERVLFDFNVKDITKISYTQGDNQLVLQPITNSKWEVVKNQNNIFVTAQKASFGSVKEFIQNLNAIYVENFIDNPIDLTDCKITNVVVATKDIEKNATFYTRDDTTYLKLDNEPTLFQLTLVNEDMLNKTFEDFQNKTLWKWRPNERLVNIQLTEKGKAPVKVNVSDVDTSVLAHLEIKQWITEVVNYPLFNVHFWDLKLETIDDQQVHRIYALKFNDRISGSVQSGQYLSEKFLFNQAWIDVLFQLIHKPFWDKMSNYFPLKQ